MEIVSESACFGGVQQVCRHPSAACGTDMTFGLFLPAEARRGPVPVLWYLSGLTCTHENAMTKAGAQAQAARRGLALVFPDTSPRGPGVADDTAFDLGQGAGFYVDASRAPWAPHFRMWTYLAGELPDLIFARAPLDRDRQAITGHSMGGHGALTLAMGLPARFRSVSAFAPICHPSESGWGRKQFAAYLGEDRAGWAAHDATLLMQARTSSPLISISQAPQLPPKQPVGMLTPAALAASSQLQPAAAVLLPPFGQRNGTWLMTCSAGE